MDGWKIRRAVNLQEDSPPVERLRALATLSSRQAHDFVIVVLDGDKPADLTGMQPWLSMILPGRASLQKQVGKVQANVVSVTLPKIGYAERGDVSIILSLMDEDGQTQIPLYGCVMRVMEDSTDTIIDEEKVIPSLAELLAQFDACKAAAGAANTAAGKAISAASAADVAAKAANTQASAAQNAATLAGKAATNAQNAADRINGMTATAASLSADETPTANLVKAGDHYELELGIPQGRKGDTGATPKIKLSVVTGEPGTDARVEQSGTPEEPLVKLTIPRGDTGSLGDLTICGKAPDQAGKVMLTAEDVGALSGTDETLTESGKAAEAAATGKALSQLKDDLAEKLGKSETAADSTKLAGKAPEYYIRPRNLLDNSDFTNPVNQRGFAIGKTSVTDTYTIDRWAVSTNNTTDSYFGLTSSYVAIAPPSISGGYIDFFQRLENYSAMKGKRYTIAAKIIYRSVESLFVSAFTMGGEHDGIPISSNESCRFYSVDSLHILFRSMTQAEGGVTDELAIKWAALYEGEYTAETLPPYVPKGYDQELFNCRYYFQRFHFSQYETICTSYQGVEYCFLNLPLYRGMQGFANVIQTGGKITVGNGTYTFSGQHNASRVNVMIGQNYSAISNPVYACYSYTMDTNGVTIDISADL